MAQIFKKKGVRFILPLSLYYLWIEWLHRNFGGFALNLNMSIKCSQNNTGVFFLVNKSMTSFEKNECLNS